MTKSRIHEQEEDDLRHASCSPNLGVEEVAGRGRHLLQTYMQGSFVKFFFEYFL